MSLVLNVEILGEFKKLTAATQGAQSDLNKMAGKANSISRNINRAFATIGVGLSFRLIARELEDVTKAAIEDRKSQELLAIAMMNTGAATDESVAAAERSISKLSIQAAVADDQLRPAYQKLFIATKDVTKSQDLLQIALDASAATGKDLDTVSQAMAKALAGNDAALAKLIPSLKGSKTPIEDMAAAFAGAADKAANVDPYQRMTTIFGEIQEKIGTALLPVLDDFAAWMSSPPGQKQLQDIADAAADILKQLGDVARWAIQNKDWLLPLVGGVLAIGAAARTVGAITTAIEAAKAAMILFNAVTWANPIIAAGGSLAMVLSLGGSSQLTGNQGNTVKAIPKPVVPNAPVIGPPSTSGGGLSVGNIQFGRQSVQPQEVNININNATVDGSDIVKALDDYYTRTGATVAY